MKKILITALFLCTALPLLFAQEAATSFDVDGIKVIFKPTEKQAVSVRVFYRGGTANYHASQAGIERLTLDALTTCGTKKYSPAAFKNTGDRYGIEITAKADYDYSDIEMQCIPAYFNEGWDIFADAITNPIFDAERLQLLKASTLSKIKLDRADPEKYSNKLMLNSAFQGTAYAADPDGTGDGIKDITADDIKVYYNMLLNKKRMFIVVAGNISKDELIQKVRSAFAAVPTEQYTAPYLSPPAWNDYKVTTENRSLATNYIYAIMNSPPVGSRDYMAYRIGLSTISGSLFMELRNKLNIAYNPGAYSVMQKMPYGLMCVSTANPQAAITAMTDELNRVITYGISEKGLKQLKDNYITANYMSQQSSSAVTLSLGEAEAMGNWQTAEELPELIDKVTAFQVYGALNKYIVGLRWSYLGNTSLVNDASPAFKRTVQ